MDDNANNGSSEPKDKHLKNDSEEYQNDKDEFLEQDEEFISDDFPTGIFIVNFDDEALKKMEETAIPFTEEEAELADYNVRKVIKELNKE